MRHLLYGYAGGENRRLLDLDTDCVSRKVDDSRPSLVYNQSMAAALRLWETVELRDHFLLARVAADLRTLDPQEPMDDSHRAPVGLQEVTP